MAEETTVHELSEKVDHREDEQRRLREEQEKIRSNGSEKKPEAQEQKKDVEQQKPPEKPKKPFAQRARRYLKRNPGRVLLGIIALVLLAVGSVLLWNYLSSYESTD